MRSAIGATSGRPSCEANWPAVMQAPSESARLLRVAEDQGPEAGGVGEAALEDAGVGDGAGVGEGDRAGVDQEADLGHLAAFAALGQGGHGQDVHRARADGAALEELERLGGVDGGPRVGAGDDGGDAACRGGGAGGAEALLVALAGLADLDADVDDAGGEVLAAQSVPGAAALEHLGDAAVARSRGRRSGCGRPRGRRGGRWSRVSTPTAPPGSLRARRLRARRSIAAMRTATPISTCSWMTLTLMSSASVPSISTPRFIGPGCMTMASGLAAASFSASRPKRW